MPPISLVIAVAIIVALFVGSHWLWGKMFPGQKNNWFGLTVSKGPPNPYYFRIFQLCVFGGIVVVIAVNALWLLGYIELK